MKKLLLIAAALMCISANAQFFQRFYGSPNNDDYLTHGINTNALGYGHFMVGHSFTNTGDIPLMAVRTDQNSAPFPMPNFFVRNYQISSGGNNLATGLAKSFEIPAGTGFGVVAEISGTVNGLAYLELDPSGNVMNIYHYFTPTAGHDLRLAHVVVNDLTNTDAIIVGTVVDNNFGPPQEYPFAMSVDIATGAINWSAYYDHFNGFTPTVNAKAYDCALVPGMGWLGIAGRATTNGATIGDDGFYMVIDITTGIWMGPTVLYEWGGNEDLRAISFSNATGLFAVTGGFDFFGQNDVLAMIFPPPPGPPFWGTVQQYNGTGTAPFNVIPSDIYSRTNTSGVAEFYIGGTSFNGNMGGSDAVVYKLDLNLTPIGQYTYGNNFRGQGVSLDGYEIPAPAGLSTFGSLMPGVSTMTHDFHHVKSYYSGESGCNENLMTPILQFIPPPFFAPIPANAFTNIINIGGVLNTVTTPHPSLPAMCFNMGIPGGSNAKVAPLEEKADREAKMSPNPVPQGASAVMLEVNTEVPVDVEIAIYDMLGKQYYSGMQHLSSGDNRLPINISSTNMAQGTYIVKITGIDFNKNLTLLVK